MKKLTATILAAILVSAISSGCISDNKTTEPPTQTQTQTAGQTEVTETTTQPVTTDAVTSASPKESSDPAALKNGLSADGYWIFAVLSDVTVEDEINVDGVFHSKGDDAQPVYRKLALYAQDADRNVTAEYTLTVPKMNVTSPNFRIQNGTVKGDIYVDAEGFELFTSTVDGNVYFKTQAQLDSAKLSEGTITGETKVGF